MKKKYFDGFVEHKQLLLVGLLCSAFSAGVCATEEVGNAVSRMQLAQTETRNETSSPASTGANVTNPEPSAASQTEPDDTARLIDDDEGDDVVENKDPLEGFNRAMFSVHEGLDTVIMKPVATLYETVTPRIMRTGITNMFDNANDVVIALNNLLQGNPSAALSDLGRVFFNTTIGMAGLFDVASNLGLEKHDEDFGQTLAVWGVGDGAFLFIPIIGPRNIRDTVGFAVDSAADPVWWILQNDVRWRNSMVGLEMVNARANLLPTDKIIEEAALDKYAYLRDGYMQRRRHQIENSLSQIRVKNAQPAAQEPANSEAASPPNK